MPTIEESDAAKYACPFRNFDPCAGTRCMAWQWHGPRVERARTDNLVATADGPRPGDTVPPTPDGDGWQQDGEPYLTGYANSAKLKLPRMTEQRWVRRLERTRGQCGRVGEDRGYDDDFPF